MINNHRSPLRSRVFGVLGLLVLVQPLSAQNLRMPSTLRYGSGLLDIPVASVLPHLTITGTYSGFTASIPEFVIVDPNGDFITVGSPYEKWLSDASVALGLFNRVEVGASIQHFAAPEDGGNLIGGFGRVSLLPSSVTNFDLAVGARYTNSPTFGDQYRYEFQPNRLGYPDSRLHKDVGDEEYTANLTPYAVATAHLPVSETSGISLTAGWGSGLFAAGGDLDFHQDGGSGGLFAGTGIHIGIGNRRQLNLIAEYNGFDTNAGVQLDLGYIRVGGFALGLTHDGYSTFRSRKFGVMASLALPTTKADTVITPYTEIRVDTTITMDAVVTVDTTVTGRALSDSDREALTAMVQFDFDSDELSEYAQTQLGSKVSVLNRNEGVEVSIEGHADDRGGEEYNMGLGMERAESTLEFLTAAGIDAGRFTTISHGEAMPLTEGTSEEARAQNRRVEFVITRETTPETVITADTVMVPDTTITETELQKADTVITPSRWSYNTEDDAADELGLAPEVVQLAMTGAGVVRSDAGLPVVEGRLEVPTVVASPPIPRTTPFSTKRPGRALG